jgi:hypothetical protein
MFSLICRLLTYNKYSNNIGKRITLTGGLTGGTGQGKENQNLNVVDNAHCTGMNIELLNWPGPP